MGRLFIRMWKWISPLRNKRYSKTVQSGLCILKYSMYQHEMWLLSAVLNNEYDFSRQLTLLAFTFLYQITSIKKLSLHFSCNICYKLWIQWKWNISEIYPKNVFKISIKDRYCTATKHCQHHEMSKNYLRNILELFHNVACVK